MKRLALLIVLALAAMAVGAYVLYVRINAPYRGYAETEQYVEIAPGLGTRAIGARLVSAGIVRDTVTFRVALWMSGEARHLQAGEYRFDRPMTPREVIGKVARGEVELVRVTFPEGLTIDEMARIFGESGLGSADDFLAASHDKAIIDRASTPGKTLEGYLFPDTYAVSRHTRAAELLRLMVDRFWTVVDETMQASAQGHGLTNHQLVTLASIVEKETARADERPIIAAVYANRLRLGMALQCDPTVIYALTRVGKYTGNLRKDDLMYDSSYNTYRYSGLPPGPIGSPGRLALKAAAEPADVDYLYFVSRNDGSHEFARTLEEHNRNVQKFQVAYFKEQRAGGAGKAGRAGR